MNPPTYRPLVCAIAGGSGSGKTTLAGELLGLLGDDADHLMIDWYYRDLSHITMAERMAVNYDHPDSLEVELFAAHLDQLRQGQAVDAPVYDFATHTRSEAVTPVAARPFIISDGILLLAVPELRPCIDIGVFVETPTDLRLERRLARDVAERGRAPDDIRRQWNEFVLPMHDEFVEPSRSNADVLVTGEDSLSANADLLADQLRSMRQAQAN